MLDRYRLNEKPRIRLENYDPKDTAGIANREQIGEQVTELKASYEDVLITSVHGTIGKKEAARRLGHIRHFEKLLTDSGTTVIKFFLHISNYLVLKIVVSTLSKLGLAYPVVEIDKSFLNL